MRRDDSKREVLRDLIRYFAFPLIAVVVLLLAFFGTRLQVMNEIRKNTYQILRDATLQQRSTLEQYIHLISTRVELIANYDADAGPNTLVESLRTELLDDATGVEIGYANPMGDLLYSDQKVFNVADEDWFSRSLRGETVVTTTSQNEDDGLTDVQISAHVNTLSGVHGVLFATLSNVNFSSKLNTLAYDSGAFSLVCDRAGNVLFVEKEHTLLSPGDCIFDVINDDTLIGGQTLTQVSKEMGMSDIIQTRILYDGEPYYLVSEAVDVCDWYVISFVSGYLADTVQQHVSMYLLGMLFIILLVGIAMSTQAYRHERSTVEKLEADKDLLRQSAQRYQLITQLSNEVFFSIDLESGNVNFNDSFEAMFGMPPPQCTIDHMDQCTELFIEQDKQQFVGLIDQLKEGGPEAHAELRMTNSRGIARWKRVEIFSVFDQSGQSTQLVGKIVDIHRQKQSMQRLIHQADSDPLTGLLNRGAMERNIKGFLSGEGSGGKHALMMLDFDNFKAVNDTLGHAKGDDLLVNFAVAIRRVYRSGDYVSRIGGDEYMIFVKNIGEDNVALDKAEAMREVMAQLSRKIGIVVSISVGVAVYQRDGKSFEKLYKAADTALYQVKRSGKNAISFFSSSKEEPRFEREMVVDDGDDLCDIDGMCAEDQEDE